MIQRVRNLSRVFDRSQPRIYYHAPDYEAPSWGIGILYKHVELLRRHGIDAAIVHRKSPFQLPWLTSDVPILYLDSGFNPRKKDILVIPEIEAKHQSIRNFPCRKFVFVQNSYLIMTRFADVPHYPNLGFEKALTIMPHLQAIIEKHFDLTASVITPFIAPYFFTSEAQLKNNVRSRRILAFPKRSNPDYDMFVKLLQRYLESEPTWEFIELKDMDHQQVAELMKEAAFFVNLNSREAFNTTVPEAMAAGCVVLCYEAYGGQDFLKDGENAYAFPDHYIFPLVEKLLELMNQYDEHQDVLARLRTNAYQTALRYTEESMEQRLIAFYENELSR